MKKIVYLLVTVLLILCVVTGCGGSNDIEKKEDDIKTEENVQKEENTSSDEVETENTTESKKEESSFDTSWAGDKYVMPIPQPPFKEFEISGEGDYQILSTNESEIAELSRQDIIDYCNELKNLGFTIELQEQEITEGNDAGYQFEATNADGVYCYVALMESRQAVYMLIETE